MDEAFLGLTAKVVSGYISNNRLPGEQLPDLIQAVYASLTTAGSAAATAEARIEPVVNVKKSVFADHLVCLACGKSFSMLKRHIRTDHQLTPLEYRARYDLPKGYAMVSPDYAKVRSKLAKKIGLGLVGNPRAAAKKARGRPQR